MSGKDELDCRGYVGMARDAAGLQRGCSSTKLDQGKLLVPNRHVLDDQILISMPDTIVWCSYIVNCLVLMYRSDQFVQEAYSSP